MSVAPSSASSPTSLVSRPLSRPPVLRALRPAVVATAACLALSACTAHMDMTIRSQGSYDVALEMRDTSGTVFPKGKAPDCSTYSDPTALGVPAGTTVKATPITGDDGIGCQVSISGVKVPQASQAEPNTIVVRDGDVYKVTIQPFPLRTPTGPQARRAAHLRPLPRRRPTRVAQAEPNRAARPSRDWSTPRSPSPFPVR